jgi:hypothetical protein
VLCIFHVVSLGVAFFETALPSLKSPCEHKTFVKFEVFTAVTMKNGVFFVVTPCGSGC